jgi:hypothetical protein
MRRTIGILVALAVVVAPRALLAAKKRPAKPAPTTAPTAKADRCDEAAIRLASADPAVPLARIRGGKIEPFEARCLATWSSRVTAWSALDAFGAIVGAVELERPAAGEPPSVVVKSGDLGAALLASPGYSSPRSVRIVATDAQRIALAKAVEALERDLVPAATYACGWTAPQPISARSLFFAVPERDGASVTHVVVGGPLLVVARVASDGTWTAVHVDREGADRCHPRVHQPRAVVDLDGDGRPELIVHRDDGTRVGDRILRLDERLGVRIVADAAR